MKMKNSKPILIASFLLLGSWLLAPGFAQASVPQLMTYHGILKNSSGDYLTGTYSLKFRIYDAVTAGNNEWTETHSSVSVTSGRFTVELGSVTALNLDFSEDYWISVEVGTDGEMTPRIRVTSVGYAVRAEHVVNGFTQSAHDALSHMSVEGVKANSMNIAKTNFKLDAYSLASANNMGDMIVDVFADATGIDGSSSSDEAWRGSPNYDVVTASGGIDDQAVFMLHMNGSDASTTFTDSSATPHTVTANGNAQIDTAQSKFSGASGLFDGSGDYLTIPDHDDFDFGTGAFTVDFWLRFNGSVPSYAILFAHGYGGATDGFDISKESGGTQLVVRAYYSTNFAWSPSADTWYHVAVVRESDGTIHGFIDGVEGSSSGTNPNTQNISNTSSVSVGADNNGTNAANVWIDDLRVSKGIARWTSNFTPPSSEYSASASSATVISKKFTEPSVPAEAMIIADSTLNSGTITYSISRDDGTTWTTAASGSITDISGQPSGANIRWKAVITDDAELDAIAVAL